MLLWKTVLHSAPMDSKVVCQGLFSSGFALNFTLYFFSVFSMLASMANTVSLPTKMIVI